MRQLIVYFRSRIRFKIILPFAVLTLMVALTGAYLSTRLVSGSLEERFNRQLVEAASMVIDGLAQRERLQVSHVNTVAFTEGMSKAILIRDRDQLQTLVFPLVVTNNIDRIDIVDADGLQLLSIYRPPGTDEVEDYITTTGMDLSAWPFVQKVLSGVVDEKGDKYVALATIDGQDLFVTVGPIKSDEEVVGAVLVSSYSHNLLQTLAQASFADVTLYNLGGNVIDTTFPKRAEILTSLTLGPEGQTMLALDGEASPQQAVTLGERDYAFLLGIFRARGNPLGFYSVALQRTFIDLSGTTARNQMVLIFTTALLLVIGIGYLSANAITGQLQHLMQNAMAVAAGDFSRRTNISSSDEIGLLARSLDHMTESLAEYTSALQNRIEELVALYESSTAVTVKSGLNLEHILQAVTTSVRDAVPGTNQVIVYLLDADHQRLVRQAPSSNASHYPATLNLAQRRKVGELFLSTKPQVVHLSELAGQGPNGHFAPTGRTAESLVVPLIAGQEMIGLLALDVNFLKSNLLNEDSERLLSTMANQAAIAIKNAQLFEATQQAYEELRQLDKLKTQFINIAAHELRTPLGAMLGYASYVEKRVPPHLHRSMRFLSSSMLRMRTMVDAMLAIQRLDAGTAFLRLSPIDVRENIKKVVTDYQPIADLEAHVIDVRLSDTLPVVQADAEKIDLVLSNLLSNAIKFTTEGGRIVVRAQSYIKGVLVSVSDSGAGITPEEQERVFDRFYQVKAEHLAGHSGMGLGLTIVKHLVELHEGQVWVESKVGHGSTFFFTLPLKEPDSSNSSSHFSEDQKNLVESA